MGPIEAGIPFPDTVTAWLLPDALVTVIVAVYATAALGRNSTWMETLECPATSKGTAGASTMNWGMLLEILAIDTALRP